MSNNVTMLAKDTISASLAECFVTVAGRRYNFMQAIKKQNLKKIRRKFRFLARLEREIKPLGGKVRVLLRFIITLVYFAR